MSPRDHEGCAVYVHIPFCDRRCPYCHFYCFVNRDPALPRRYAMALVGEWRAQEAQFVGPIHSVYFGGGTPSALSPEGRELLCRWLVEELEPRLVPDAEITLEVNPESAWPESLDEWVAAGVNRLSLGVQSMEPEVLSFLGRLNTPVSNRRALELACARVENVSLDLILATPPNAPRGLEESFRLLDEYPVSHVSAYLLEIHAKTRFGRDVAAGRWHPRADDEQAEIYLAMVDALGERGFEHYEVSNFARSRRTSRHNQAYWSGRAYLGLGASAHSYHAKERWWNLADAVSWCERIEAGEAAQGERETLGAGRLRDEELLLGLRTREGLDPSWREGRESLWKAWERAGLVDPESSRPRLTPRGWLVMDQIVERLSRG